MHFLPPYSPNLNPIERLWKFVNEKVLYIPKQVEELGFRRSQSLGIQAIERGSILQYGPSFDR